MILGLDIGSNSIGFAIKKENKIIKAGSVIFSSGRDEKTNVSLSEKRRIIKSARNLLKKRKIRKQNVLKFLQENDLFPKDKIECDKLKLLNPYEIRSKGVLEILPKYHFGRVIMNLTVKRGFKSNKVESEKEVEEKGLKLKQGRLSRLLQRTNLTLGQFLYKNQKKGRLLKQVEENKYNALRSHYEYEFERLKQVHHSYLTKEKWEELHHLLFFQEPLKEQPLGRCIFDGEERVRKFMPSFQHFKVLQTVNNIRIEKKQLTSEQRTILTSKLKEENVKLNQKSILKLLNLKNVNVSIPVRDSKTEEVGGDETYSKMIKVIPDWKNFSLKKQDEIMLAIYHENWDCLPSELTEMHELKNLTFKPKEVKTASLSLNIISKIIPHLENGMMYHEAMEKEGFVHSTGDVFDLITGELLNPEKYQAREFLPSYKEVLTSSLNVKGEISNPTTHVILNNLQKLVNKIIKKYGKIEAIHLELAREIGLGAEGIQKLISEQNKNKKENERLNSKLKTLGERETNENRLKLKLFEELPPSHQLCVYSGTRITLEKVFSSEVEVEHILPQSITFDNAKSNLCLAYREMNAKKGNRSPYEAFGEECYLRAKILFEKNNAKLWRFEPDAMEKYLKNPEIRKKKLHDTKHASRLAAKYLNSICPNVICIKGAVTGIVRSLVSFNSILSESGEKNRNDHRHHALDACLLTLIDRGFLSYHFQKLLEQRGDERKNYDKILEIKKSYYDNISNVIKDVTVFHKPRHKLLNAFHEETIYSGKTRINREISIQEFILKFGKSLNYENIVKKKLREQLLNISHKEFLSFFESNKISKILITEMPEKFVKSRTAINDISEKNLPDIVDKKLREEVTAYIQNLTENDKENDFADLIEKDKTLAKKSAKEIGILKFFKNSVKKIKILYKQSFSVELSGKRLVKPEFSHLAVFLLPAKFNDSQLKNRMQEVEKEYGCFGKVTKEGIFVLGVYKTFIGKFLNPKFAENKERTVNYNKIRPHPNAKLLFTVQTGDMIKAVSKKEGEEQLFRVSRVSAVNGVISGVLINKVKSQNASGYDIQIVFNDFKKCKLRKVFVSPLGELMDFNKWYKK